MKPYFLLVIILSLVLVLTGCTDKKKEQPDAIPAEADNGIGDGAPSLDSLLLQEPKDTLKPN